MSIQPGRDVPALMSESLELARATITGHVRLLILRANGRVDTLAVDNLITDAGDTYHAARVAAGVAPAVPAQPAALISGMKLGINTTAAAKNGPGATLGGYLPGARALLDVGYPQVTAAGAGAGTQVAYRATFGPGVGTGSAIAEAVLCTDAGTDVASPADAVIARVTFAPQAKNPGDTLLALWVHTHLAG